MPGVGWSKRCPILGQRWSPMELPDDSGAFRRSSNSGDRPPRQRITAPVEFMKQSKMGSAKDLPTTNRTGLTVQRVSVLTSPVCASSPGQVHHSICASSRGDPPLRTHDVRFASPGPSPLSVLSPSASFRPNPTGSDQFRPIPTKKKLFLFSAPTTDN